MTVLQAGGLKAFVAGGRGIGILLHGPEESKSAELARACVRQIAGSIDDPFLVTRLEDSDLLSDPGRLPDELASQSMFGGRRAVWVEGAGAGLHKALAGTRLAGGNMFVAVAGNLAKTSALRQFCEESGEIASVASYEDTAEDVLSVIESAVKAAGLAIDDDAARSLVSLLEGSRAAARGEMEKLLTYCCGQRSITAADVEAVCSATGETAVDGLVDAVFCGDLAAVDREYESLLLEGDNASRLLTAVAGHGARLDEMVLETSAGKPPMAAIKSSRPPIFFKRERIVLQQLRQWTPETIARANVSLHLAIKSCRECAALEDEIAGRALLSVARSARRG